MLFIVRYFFFFSLYYVFFSFHYIIFLFLFFFSTPCFLDVGPRQLILTPWTVFLKTKLATRYSVRRATEKIREERYSITEIFVSSLSFDFSRSSCSIYIKLARTREIEMLVRNARWYPNSTINSIQNSVQHIQGCEKLLERSLEKPFSLQFSLQVARKTKEIDIHFHLLKNFVDKVGNFQNFVRQNSRFTDGAGFFKRSPARVDAEFSNKVVSPRSEGGKTTRQKRLAQECFHPRLTCHCHRYTYVRVSFPHARDYVSTWTHVWNSKREREREHARISRNVSACTWPRRFVPQTRTRGTKLRTVRQALIAW